MTKAAVTEEDRENEETPLEVVDDDDEAPAAEAAADPTAGVDVAIAEVWAEDETLAATGVGLASVG